MNVAVTSKPAAHPKKPHVLVILDGFGHREDTADNAILAAKTPHLDRIRSQHPHGLISGSGEDVGLPEGQFGNSEVGHMNLGAGRVLYQDLTRISKDIREGTFYQQPVLLELIERIKQQNGALHLLGLLSEGGVHAHQDHIFAAARLGIQQGVAVYVHAFLDGRDTPPRSAMPSLSAMNTVLAEDPTGRSRLVTICGRYFAMDRDERWDRVAQAYDLLTLGQGHFTAPTAEAGLEAAYARDESDEFVKTTVIGTPQPIQDGDGVLFMNYRADRAREITRALVEPDFQGFARQVWPKLAGFVQLTQYAANIPAPVAYAPQQLVNSLGEYLANQGRTQLRIAETEKYAHVTFFFSGGREQPFEGEERILIKSPDVATYDLKPEMSAHEVTDALVAAIKSGQFDFLVVNYANGDMVGHTGVFDAAVKAVETLDQCLVRVYDAVQGMNGDMLITADHGNVEQMMDYESGQVHTQHTTEHVPLIYVGQQAVTIREGGVLADIAPTILGLMGLPVPAEMQGKNLLIPITSADTSVQSAAASL